MITDYYDLTALLIAAIDSERDPELTIECAKLLMMKRYIPYRIRLQLFQMDINNLSVTSKQTLFSILSDLNKIRTNFDDIQDVISVIENKKQMTKIYLYAFVNTLLESQSQLQKEVCVINYAVSTHDYRVMAMYNIQHSMLCPEIINSYIDYLLKIGGNYIQATKIVSSISSIRNSLIKINDSTPLLKFSDSKSRLEIDLPNGSELISNQKTLEIVPNWGLRLIILVSILLVIFIYFPVLTLENIEHSKTLKNNEYFRHDHSPPYYISSYTVKNIYSYFKIYNVTFDPKILSLFNITGLNELREYLDKVVCALDGKTVLGGLFEKPENWTNYLYDLYAKKLSVFYLSDQKFEYLNSHHSLETCFESFLPVIDRYEQCALNVKQKSNFKIIGICCGISGFLILLTFIVTFGSLGGIVNKMVKIYNSIENTTLEEFRSNLFVDIHSQAKNKMNVKVTEEIDNDGALDLEEIEENELQVPLETDEVEEMIEKGLKGSITFKTFSPRHRNYFVLYCLLIFILRYMVGFITVNYYEKVYINLVKSNILEHSAIDFAAKLFLQIDAYFAKVTYNETVLFEKPETNETEFTEICEKWNDFMDKKTFKIDKENLKFFEEIMQNVSYYVESLYDKNSKVYARENYMENVHFISTLFLIFFLMYFLFIFIYLAKFIMSTVAHIVLVLKSKYNSTLSRLINSISFNEKKEPPFDFQNLSELIVSNSIYPIIFFDIDFNVTFYNQQATAQISSDLENLVNFLPVDKNMEFFEFAKMTTKSLGIRARKNFDFFVFTESENKLTPFSGVFIPLQNCNFALILKDQSEIIEMKDELDRLHKQISLVLKRLVHPMIAMKTVLDEMPNLTTKEKCVIFCCQMKTIEYVKPEIELFDYEITEVCISIFDRLLSKYNKICRMRTFNEDFVFIGGFFDDDSPGERIEEIIKFAQDAANDINHFLECNILLSGSINYGGPVHCGFSGISKTMFDYWSKAIIDCYDILDVVPPGKLLLFEDAYNYINDKSLFIPYRPTREIEQNLFIMQSYLGMGFTD